MHFLIGMGIIAGLIAFAFGANAARAFVGAGLAAAALAFAYIMFLIITNQI